LLFKFVTIVKLGRLAPNMKVLDELALRYREEMMGEEKGSWKRRILILLDGTDC
jgi:hypothetical protein